MRRPTFFISLAALMAIGVIGPAAASHSFDDVPDNHVFHTDIAWLAVEEITAGCNPPTNDHYCPTSYVTRGQMAAFLVRALGLTDDGGGDHFSDDNNSVFETDIDKLFTAGITSGCNPPTNDHYCPTSYVTRGQMAAFLVRALDLPAASLPNPFTDDDGSIFEDDIERLAAQGITKGCNPPVNDRFCPDDPVTRGQMAAFLNRAFNKAPEKVLNVVVTTGGGSEEISVSWDVNTESDAVSYNVWHSTNPGETKNLIDPHFGPREDYPGGLYIIDYPRDLIDGTDCYEVSAVDGGGLEGARSEEACFDSTPGPPSQVMNVTAGLAGGSGEVDVSWDPVPEYDVDYYNVWYSLLPGGTKSLVPESRIFDSGIKPGGRRYIVDTERSLSVGQDCYQVSAVDFSGNEGTRSAEACFDPFL